MYILTFAKGSSILFAVTFLLTASQAVAGYLYEFSETRGGQAETAMVVRIEGASIKLSQSKEASSETIFDGGTQALMMIDHAKRRYTNLDKETLVAVAEKLTQAMAEMEAQLAGMPPAQREMMERMMKGAIPQAAAALPEVTFKRTGETDTIAGIKAEKVEQFADGRKSKELWIASWADLKGGESIKEAFVNMSELFQEIATAFSQGPMKGMFTSIGERSGMNQLADLGGFPVKAVDYDASGTVDSEMALTHFEVKAFPSETFKAPKGYKKQKVDF